MTAALALLPAPESWTLPGQCRGCYRNHRDGNGYCDCKCHVLTDSGWRELALCEGDDPGLFIGPDRETIAERRARETAATEICGWCPVTAECLRFAARTRSKFGVYGGTGQVERQEMRKALYRRNHADEAAA